LVAIGTSNGGPVPLAEVLTNCRQFSRAFAVDSAMQRLYQGLCRAPGQGWQDSRSRKPGRRHAQAGVALLAPGWKQMMLGWPLACVLRILARRLSGFNFKPCVDVTLGLRQAPFR